MIVVLRAHGLRFFIFVDDHEPAHVHVWGDGRMRIEIRDGVRLLSASHVKGSDIRKAMSAVAANRDLLLAKWDEIHGRDKRR